jgi:hypothetical protein
MTVISLNILLSILKCIDLITILETRQDTDAIVEIEAHRKTSRVPVLSGEETPSSVSVLRLADLSDNQIPQLRSLPSVSAPQSISRRATSRNLVQTGHN